MNKELAFFLFFSRKFPKWSLCRIIVNRVISPFYNRKERAFEISDVLGFKMQLDPSECIDSGLLFFPQYYDFAELDAICNIITDNGTIIDIGSHIGFYSLFLSKRVTKGSIVAFEADPNNFQRLKSNLALNPEINNVKAINIGVSDKFETLSLGLNTSGNKSGNSFLSNSKNRIEVQCKPLVDLLLELNIQKVNLIKIDIEGFEFRVFKQFFSSAPKSIFPEWILVEDNPTITQEGNTIDLLKENGYLLFKDFGLNKLMKRSF